MAHPRESRFTFAREVMQRFAGFSIQAIVLEGFTKKLQLDDRSREMWSKDSAIKCWEPSAHRSLEPRRRLTSRQESWSELLGQP